jgi:FkbM family methyltransferase
MSAEKDVDLIVLQTFFHDKETPGVFVEVGAAHPEFLSISARYRQLGWKIISIEPNPEFCKIHRGLGYTVHEYACGDTDQDNVDFYVVDSKGVDYGGGNVSFESFSSLGIKDEFSDLYKTVENEREVSKIKVNVRRLDTIMEECAPDLKKIDILAIDVEGWELNVLAGFSLNNFEPKVVILENLFNKREYTEYMQSNGYFLWKKLDPNEVYVSKKLKSDANINSGFLDKIKSFFQFN